MPQKLKWLVLVVLHIYLAINSLSAQRSYSMRFNQISQVNGLSSPNVRKIIKDQKGFIWIATQDGLNRFDGVDMMHFNSSEVNKRNTIGNDFHDIIFDSSNQCIWAVTSNGGLNKIDINSCAVKKIATPSTLFINHESVWYKSLLIKENHLYVGIKDGFILIINCSTEKISSIVDLHSLVGRQCLPDKIFMDASKNFWLLCEGGSIIILDSTLKHVTTVLQDDIASKPKSEKIYTFYDYSIYQNTLYLATSYGLKAVNIKSKTFESKFSVIAPTSLSLLSLKTLTVKIFGCELYFSNQSGLYVYNLGDGSLAKIIDINNKNKDAFFSNIFALFKNESQLWLGNTEGLSVIKNVYSPFTTFFKSYTTDVSIKHTYNMYAENDSSVYVCASDGLYHVTTTSGLIEQLDHTHSYYNVFSIKKGLNFATSDHEIFEIRNKKLALAKDYYHELKTVSGDFIIGSANFHDSLIFLASQNNKGLYQWNIERHEIKVINDKTPIANLKNLDINSLYVDHRGKLLVVCANVITAYDFLHGKTNHNFIRDPQTKQPFEILMDLCEAKENYFIAVYGKGIIKTDHNFKVLSIISTDSGISNLGLYKLFNCNDSLLIASSNNGLFLYNLNTGHVRSFTKADGLQSDNFEETSGSESPKFIFVGGIDGLTRIDPLKFHKDTAPPTFFITSIKIKTPELTFDTINLEIRNLVIQNDWLQVTISFTGLNFANPEKNLYQYRIKELDTTWINNGNRMSLNLIGLAPGKHTVEIRAMNEDGFWSVPEDLFITFLPKWYQTLLFKVLVFVIIAAIPFAFYRYKVSQLKKQQQIRQSISSDLHDDIGATLNSIKLFTHLALSADNKDEHLKQIIELLGQASMGLRDMIWVLDDSRDSATEFINRVKQFAVPAATASNIIISFNIDPDIKEELLTKAEKRNLYLITKEAINNSIKYSGCSKIVVNLTEVNKKISLVIQDNGKGFDEQAIEKGNGLRNICERARQINYACEITSFFDKGTKTSLHEK